MLKLVSPDSKYKQSFLEALKEYHADPSQAQRLEIYRKLNVEELDSNFDQYVADLRSQSMGIGLPEGYVPQSIYWLVDGETYIGRVDIRHELTETLRATGGHIGYDIRPSERNKGYGKVLLQLGIEKAHELGIKDIVMTCDVDNVGSNKVIQANGGELIADISLPANKNRYLIRK